MPRPAGATSVRPEAAGAGNDVAPPPTFALAIVLPPANDIWLSRPPEVSVNTLLPAMTGTLPPSWLCQATRKLRAAIRRPNRSSPHGTMASGGRNPAAPKAALPHTLALESSPPTPPSDRGSRWPTPSLPIWKTLPPDTGNGWIELTSVSDADSERQFAGAQYARRRSR